MSTVDTVLVLKRDQGSPYAVLYIRGRDIQETEIAMQFDDDTGRWIKLGPADDFRKSQERKAVVRALIDAGKAMTPAEMVDVLGKKRGTVKVLLHRMAKDGEIVSLGNGTYMTRQD